MAGEVPYYGSDGRLMVKTGAHPRLYWRKADLEMLKTKWATTSGYELAELIGMSYQTLRRKAKELGLKKHPDYRRRANQRNIAMSQLTMKLRGNKGWAKPGERRGRETEFKPAYLVQRLDTGYIGYAREIARQLDGDISNVSRCAKGGWRFRGVYLKIYEQLNTKNYEY